jgi:hypothetical protein
MHVVQLTPRGSGCSIVFGDLPSQNEMQPGSIRGLQLVVSHVKAAREELANRDVEVSDLMVMAPTDGGTFCGFRDPDGNSWDQGTRAQSAHPARPHRPQRMGRQMTALPATCRIRVFRSCCSTSPSIGIHS